MARLARNTDKELVGVKVGELKTPAMRRVETDRLSGRCVRETMIERIRQGKTMKQIGETFGIAEPTANRWRFALNIMPRHIVG
tara:strand:- start:423 stop:671 length:249 start_codon:yes stop_codon:yes gene_type:complete